MTLIEWMLMIVFVVPIVVCCVAFVLMAVWMNVQEEVKRDAQAAELHA